MFTNRYNFFFQIVHLKKATNDSLLGTRKDVFNLGTRLE